MGSSAKTILEKALNSRWLTKRDREILVLLYYRKVLTPKEIWKIHSPQLTTGLRIFQNRLHILEKHKLIKHYWYGEKHYVLNTAGAYLVADTLGIPYEQLKWRINDMQTVTNLEHYKRINEVGILLNSQYNLIRFKVGVKIETKNSYFITDALGTLIHKKQFDFYLELDRGTQSPKIYGVEGKVHNYSQAYLKGLYKEDFKMFPFVLIVTMKNKKRAEKIVQYIAEAKKKLHTDETYMVTTMEELRKNPYGAIWIVPFKNKKYSVLQGGLPL